MEDIKVEKRTLGTCAVYMGEDMLKDIVPYLRSAFEEGVLLCLYDVHVKELADNVMYELKKGGYRIFALGVEPKRSRQDEVNLQELKEQMPEFTRYILAIGSGSVVEIAKGLSCLFSIGWSLVLTAPTIDTIMCGYPPKQVFIDRNVIDKCPVECIASGYGIALSSQFLAFENMFERKILARETHDECVQNPTSQDLCELAFSLLKISYFKHKPDSADLLAGVLYNLALEKGKRPRLFGEYKFLASAVLTNLYSLFLSAPSIDIMPPPVLSMQKYRAMQLFNTKNGVNVLSDFCNIEHNANKGIVFSKSTNTAESQNVSVNYFDTNDYFRISYILGEYRMDLLDKLSSIDLHSLQRFWRRLYKDAGYWLKSEITSTKLLECASIAGANSDNLLGLVYASGVMSNF